MKKTYPSEERKKHDMGCLSGSEDWFVLNHSDLDFGSCSDEEFRCKMAGVRWAGMDKGSKN